tara:strand:+ start:405 stop:1001 length:597 start_codon:yes stop_codon:yes gene_type:complete
MNNKKINLFIHLPKCGGVAVRKILNKENVNLHCYNHTEYDKIPKNIIEQSFIFTFIRNPWDRIVSLYFFWKQQDKNHRFYHSDKKQVDYINKLDMSFKDFTKEIVNKKSIFYEKRHLHPYIGHFFPTADCIDFIGRFENFQQDFNIICDKIGIPHQQLPHKNKSRHKHYTEYYDDKTRQIVAEIYSRDIEHFGYKFGD